MLTSSQESTGPQLREAFHLGGAMASVTWLWIAAIDQLSGHSFQTFDLLGGVGAFTVGHFLLNFFFAAVVVSAARASAQAPSLVIALIFGFVMLEIGFAMLAVVLGQTGLGGLAWIQIFGGSLIALAIMGSHLLRNYPMGHLLHRAEEER